MDLSWPMRGRQRLLSALARAKGGIKLPSSEIEKALGEASSEQRCDIGAVGVLVEDPVAAGHDMQG